MLMIEYFMTEKASLNDNNMFSKVHAVKGGLYLAVLIVPE